MSDESIGKSTSTELAEQRTSMAGERTRWAADRTLWAADRTFIAWLRTSISMIGFGIGIGKAGDALESQGVILDSYHSMQIVGRAFISLAVLGRNLWALGKLLIAREAPDCPAAYSKRKRTA